MSQTSKFDGIITALATPFTDTGAIDFNALDALIDAQLEAGVTGLLPVGTTGESVTLSEDEAAQVIAHTVKRAKGKAYILAGTGSNSTAKTIKATKRAAEEGADGVLLASPYYNKPTQHGLIAHYEAVADCVDIDNILYSVPGRAVISINAETAGHLARSRKNIVAIKEAGGDPARVTELRRHCGTDFAIHCGDDGLALSFYILGACGLTSVLSNYDPAMCVAIYDAWKNKDMDRALALHDVAAPLADAMFIESSPVPVKYALAKQGKLSATVRLPLAPLCDASQKAVDAALGEYHTKRKALLD